MMRRGPGRDHWNIRIRYPASPLLQAGEVHLQLGLSPTQPTRGNHPPAIRKVEPAITSGIRDGGSVVSEIGFLSVRDGVNLVEARALARNKPPCE